MADPLYVRARAALLDTVEALSDHRNALVLVGAQAVYFHTGDVDLDVAEYTTDADFTVSPSDLPPLPYWPTSSGHEASPSPAFRWLAQPRWHLHGHHGP